MLQTTQIDVAHDPIVMQWIDEYKQLDNPTIVTDDNAQMASDNLRSIKEQIKEINARRMKMTRPMDEAKKEIMRQARELLQPLEEAKNSLESHLLKYQVEKKRKEEEHQRMLIEQERQRLLEEQKELEEQAAMNESDLALEDALAVEEEIKAVDNIEIKATGRVRSTYSTSTIRYKWTHSLVDFSLVPDEYKKLDDVKIRRVITGDNGTREIPGLKINKEAVLSTRGR